MICILFFFSFFMLKSRRAHIDDISETKVYRTVAEQHKTETITLVFTIALSFNSIEWQFGQNVFGQKLLQVSCATLWNSTTCPCMFQPKSIRFNPWKDETYVELCQFPREGAYQPRNKFYCKHNFRSQVHNIRESPLNMPFQCPGIRLAYITWLYFRLIWHRCENWLFFRL